MTNFKRVRPAGLLKERKPIYLLIYNLKVGKLSQVAKLVDAKDFPLELNIHTGSNPVLTTKQTQQIKL